MAESSPRCFNSITWSNNRYLFEKHTAREEASIQTGSRKVQTYPFSLTPANLSLQHVENTKFWVHQHTHVHISLGSSSQTLPLSPLLQVRLRLRERFCHSQSPAEGESLITHYHFADLCLHLPSVWTLT